MCAETPIFQGLGAEEAIQVVDARAAETTDGHQADSASSVMLYEVRVTIGGAHTSVWKRFRDFEALHRLVKSAYYGHLASNVPHLPPKTWGVLSMRSVPERQQQLQRYMRLLMGLPRIAFNPDVLLFLGLLPLSGPAAKRGAGRGAPNINVSDEDEFDEL